jgi:hypothetical protein
VSGSRKIVHDAANLRHLGLGRFVILLQLGKPVLELLKLPKKLLAFSFGEMCVAVLDVLIQPLVEFCFELVQPLLERVHE